MKRLLALMVLLMNVFLYQGHGGDTGLATLIRYWLPAYLKGRLDSLVHVDSYEELEADQRGNDGRERGRSTDI